jgi:hypothetical protein
MAVAELERHRHPDPACAIDLPAGFDVGTMPGVLLVARAPDGFSASPFAPNVALAAQRLPPDADLGALGDAALARAECSFPAWRLLDRTDTAIGGMDGQRTLATYLVRPGSGVDLGRDVSIAVEQWYVVGDGLAWIVSGSSESADYGQVCDLWAASAESLRPGESA